MATDIESPVAYHHRWERALLADTSPLPTGFSKVYLYAYCSAMAAKGRDGKGCFAGDSTIGRELQIYNRRTISKYRHLAIELGWFVRTGKSVNRVEKLDISIPSECKPAPVVPDEPVSVPEPLAETPPVADPWETNGVTKVVPKPVASPSALWGEAAEQAEQAGPSSTDGLVWRDGNWCSPDDPEPAPWDLPIAHSSNSDDPWA